MFIFLLQVDQKEPTLVNTNLIVTAVGCPFSEEGLPVTKVIFVNGHTEYYAVLLPDFANMLGVKDS